MHNNNFFNKYVGTMNKIIHKNSKLKKAKKHNVYQLFPRHVNQRRKFCRILN